MFPSHTRHSIKTGKPLHFNVKILRADGSHCKVFKVYAANGFLPALKTFNHLNWRQFFRAAYSSPRAAPSYTVLLGARRLPGFLLLLFSYALFILARDIHTFMNIYTSLYIYSPAVVYMARTYSYLLLALAQLTRRRARICINTNYNNANKNSTSCGIRR